jgi:hypothetical protein
MVPRSPPYDYLAPQSSGSAPKMGLLGNSRDMQSPAAWLLPASDAVANFVTRTRYGLKVMSETKMSFRHLAELMDVWTRTSQVDARRCLLADPRIFGKFGAREEHDPVLINEEFGELQSTPAIAYAPSS